MRILITLPVWNEATIIRRSLEILHDAILQRLPDDAVRIEVVDNGSTDRTADIVQALQWIESDLYLRQIPDAGKGRAIRTSWMAHVDGADILVFMDADLAADLGALSDLIEPIRSGDADVVCGSRFVSGARTKRRAHREVLSRLYRVLQRSILRLPVQDAQCGFKAISRHAAAQLLPTCQENGWLFDTELLALANAAELNIREIPVQWVEHRDPARRSALLIWRDGWDFLLGLAKIRYRLFRLNTAKKM